MKRSDLKSFIREEIINELSEDIAYQVTGTSGKAVQSFKNDQEARDFDAKASNVTVKKLEESPNDLIEKIKNFNLIDPVHIELARSGYGEFPDSYKFTDNGAKEIANLLSESNVTVKKLEEEKKYSFPEVLELVADIISQNLELADPTEIAREILDELDNKGLIDHAQTDANDTLEEMARAKVSYALNIDKAQELKNIIDMAKGNVKKALEYLLDKETMSVADVAKELGLKDTASINNPKFRELMNALKEKGVVSLVGSSEAPKEKPSKEKAAIKSVEKDMETGEEEADDYYKADDEDSTPEETDIDKQAAKAANKLTKRTSKLDKVLKGLIQVEKEMKELAGEYKNAEGEEKANIVAKLKEKTAQKKELEALKDKFEFDVV